MMGGEKCGLPRDTSNVRRFKSALSMNFKEANQKPFHWESQAVRQSLIVHRADLDLILLQCLVSKMPPGL